MYRRGNEIVSTSKEHIYKECRLRGLSVTIDLFRGACAVKETSRLRVTSSVSTTEPLSTHDVTLVNVDGSLFHIQI